MKLDEAIENYIESKKEFLKPYTMVIYRDRKQYIIKHFGNVEIEQIDTDFLQGKIKELLLKELSVVTIRSCIALIKCAIPNKIDKLHYQYKDIEIKQSKERYYTPEQIKEIQSYILKHNKKTYIPIMIAINTGMRIGEIIALKWSDIDFENQEINVNKNLSIKKGVYYESTTKTKSGMRKIPMNETLAKYLKQFKSDNDLYVITNNNKTKEITIIDKANRKLLKELGITSCGMHAYRHSFATELLRKSDNYKAIADIMGHKNINITQNIYTHSTSEDRQEIINKKRTYKKQEKSEKSEQQQPSMTYGQINNINKSISALSENVEKIIFALKILDQKIKKLEKNV